MFSEFCIPPCYRCLCAPRVVHTKLISCEITPIEFVVRQPAVCGDERPLAFCPKALHSEDDGEWFRRGLVETHLHVRKTHELSVELPDHGAWPLRGHLAMGSNEDLWKV